MTEQGEFFKGETERNWLKSILNELVVTIEFEKVDGSTRKLVCTLSPSKIPVEKSPKNAGKAKNEEILAVFDVEKQDWRSFRWDSVRKVEFNLLGK
jgi:hypothetical protein